MNRRHVRLGWTALAVVAAMVVGAYAALSAQGKTQWDGVYTAAQAQRGEMSYVEHCARCHGFELEGSEMAPPLTGPDFNMNWNTLSLDRLFDRMKNDMPATSPGILSRQVNADILAYVLAKGGYPAESAELPSEAGALAAITFLTRNPKAN